MDENLIKSILGSIFRWLITLLVGFLVTKKIVTPEQADAWQIGIAGLSLAIAGGLMTLAWSIYSKYRTKAKIETALDLPAGSTPKQLDRAFKAQ